MLDSNYKRIFGTPKLKESYHCRSMNEKVDQTLSEFNLVGRSLKCLKK